MNNDFETTTKINMKSDPASSELISPTEILIEESQTSQHVEDSASTRTRKLSEKIDEFLFKLGYSSVHTVGILLQLMIDGKIRIDFKNYTERLELVNKNQMMNRASALALFENYITQHQQENSTSSESSPERKKPLLTQKVIVQIPNHLQS